MYSIGAFASRQELLLKDSWEFCRGEVTNNSQWENVTVPHDWAIYGPFDKNIDLQVIAIEQNLEKTESLKTGRTGGLPYVGKGTYRTTFNLDAIDNKSITLLFDGAMSHAHVKVNGKEVGFWAYGYNSFYFNIDDVAKVGTNELEVSLENKAESSRWYPGAGLYRNVHLIITDKVHIPVWGTYIRTPYVSEDYATVALETKVSGCKAL